MLLDIGRIYHDIVQKDKDKSIQVVAQEINPHVHELTGALVSKNGITMYLKSPHHVLHAIL